MTNKYHIYLIKIIIYILFQGGLMAQNTAIDLANEYFSAGEYDKALDQYAKESQNVDNTPLLYDNYVYLLYKFDKLEDLEKYLKKLERSFAENPVYSIELENVYLLQNKNKDADKQNKKVAAQYTVSSSATLIAYRKYLLLNMMKNAEQILETARRVQNKPYAFAAEMAYLYKLQGRKAEMIDELLNGLQSGETNPDQVKIAFQDMMDKPEDFELLETTVLTRYQREPQNEDLSDLIIWMYVQVLDFQSALEQGRAADRNFKYGGRGLMQLAEWALDANRQQDAADILTVVMEEYKGKAPYYTARARWLAVQETIIKSEFPIDKSKIRNLIEMYKDPGLYNDINSKLSVARLYAFYLNNLDTAIIILTEAKKQSTYDKNAIDKVKIQLADIYVLKGEWWESVFLYEQVIKSQGDSPMGHEAKFKNATLAYYRGDFLWAADMLDVLKEATTREISNDAIKLSLFIRDNTIFDTVGIALTWFAKAQQYQYQMKYKEAVSLLDSVLRYYPNHTLADDVWLEKGNIYAIMALNDSAVYCYLKVATLYATDILADDALFKLGILYEEVYLDKPKALEYFLKVLTDHTSSVYGSQARRHIRKLRGEKQDN